MPQATPNYLYYGDNLDILREYIDDESIDLIYLDPPFNSQATYNVLFAEKSGEKSAAQITAFEDTWHWGRESEYAYWDVVSHGPTKTAKLLSALREFLGNNDMMAYLTMMAQRLVELHRVLKPTGSIYLHCDPTASHYLKLLMDAVFGPERFRNEIIWKRTTAHSSAKRYGPIHDVLLYYSKSDKVAWNAPRIDYDEQYLEKYYRYDDGDGRLYWRNSLTAAGIRHGSSGKPWRGIDITATGQHWKFKTETLDELDAAGKIYWPPGGKGFPQIKRYRDELKGLAVSDIWTDIDRINQVAAERLGYPTQKPEALLERIIRASSNEGDIVLDPFCGCGTAIAVAERLHRRWIGIDITHLAIALMRHRLHDTFGADLSPYEVHGDPKDLSSAQALAAQDRHQFEWWALGLVDARPAQDKRKGADSGIDGYIRFLDDNSGKVKTVIVQVKSGHVSVSQVRDLKGVMQREKAEIGAFITLERPTRQMETEASAGFYEPVHFPGHHFPRVQILTIEEILSGKTLEYPRFAPPATFKRAERRNPDPERQQQLF